MYWLWYGQITGAGPSLRGPPRQWFVHTTINPWTSAITLKSCYECLNELCWRLFGEKLWHCHMKLTRTRRLVGKHNLRFLQLTVMCEETVQMRTLHVIQFPSLRKRKTTERGCYALCMLWCGNHHSSDSGLSLSDCCCDLRRVVCMDVRIFACILYAKSLTF